MIYSIKDVFPRETGVYKFWFDSNPARLYVGSALGCSKTRFGFYSRWKRHIKDASDGKHNSKVNASVNKYGVDDIRFSIIEVTSIDNGLVREQYWMDYYNSFNNGLNCSPTAISSLGVKWSDEAKEQRKIRSLNKIAPKIIELYQLGVSYDEICFSLKTSKERIREVVKKFNIPKRVDLAINNKEVYCYNKKGELLSIEMFPALAIKKYNTTSDNIYQVLNKSRFTTSNMHFSYSKLSSEEIVKLFKTKSSKRAKMINIKQFDTSGLLIKVWNNTEEIKEFFNIKTASAISDVIGGKKKTFKGFVWEL